jgi:hypothetical protein
MGLKSVLLGLESLLHFFFRRGRRWRRKNGRRWVLDV